jgi:energy-coupling factor transporter transmembrane protein EcfT
MPRLELKIPPVALVILCAFTMWLVARMNPGAGIQIAGREWVALVILIVGFALIIAGASAFISAKTTAIFLENILSALLLPLFILCMNRFQIIPEENTLLTKFGDEYARYLKSVRRWL